MGDPKRIRKKYERPKAMWDRLRIDREHELKSRYGLKNLRELWKATTEVGRIRRNVREVLSGRAQEHVGTDIISRLASYGIVNKDAKLDDLLGLAPEAILNRRLQSLVLKKGLAKSTGQSRQLIAHGFIAIDGRRVRSPSYLVKTNEEAHIGFYKPINLETKAPAPQAEAEPEKKEEKKEETKNN
jgi:small subunit ribosomal protein S4